MNWQIRPPARACAHCGTPFPDRSPVRSLLLFAPPSSYTRLDFCPSCFPSGGSGAPPPSLDPSLTPHSSLLTPSPVSDWSTTYHAPPPPSPEPLPRASAESLLRTLLDSPAPPPDILFILAVMLERKRTLVERSVHAAPDGSVTRLYEHRKTGESFLIPDPNLRLADIPPLQTRVLALLDNPPA